MSDPLKNVDPNAAVKNNRMFELVLDDLNNGQTPSDLAQSLKEAVEAVKKTGKMATVTFSMKIKPGNRGAVEKVEIEDSIKCNIPSSDRAKSYFFVDKECTLTRKDPNQPELDLKSIEITGPVQLKRVGE